MDHRNFDSLARSLAAPRSRRGIIGGLAAFVAGARAASATVDPCPVPGQTLNRKGVCVCPPGTSPCPGGCVNLRDDEQHCGTCENPCGYRQICQKGTCRNPPGTCWHWDCSSEPCTWVNTGDSDFLACLLGEGGCFSVGACYRWSVGPPPPLT